MASIEFVNCKFSDDINNGNNILKDIFMVLVYIDILLYIILEMELFYNNINNIDILLLKIYNKFLIYIRYINIILTVYYIIILTVYYITGIYMGGLSVYQIQLFIIVRHIIDLYGYASVFLFFRYSQEINTEAYLYRSIMCLTINSFFQVFAGN